MAGTYLGLYLNDSHLLLQMFLNMKIQLTKNVRLRIYSSNTRHWASRYLLLGYLLNILIIKLPILFLHNIVCNVKKIKQKLNFHHEHFLLSKHQFLWF